MRIVRVVVLASALTSPAAAQLPAALDASRYPQLAAMQSWFQSGAAQTRHCALSGGLFTEASDIYRLNRSEPRTLEAMMKRHAETLNPSDREQLRDTLTHVTGMAAGLADLSAETAPIAYSQLCIGRAQRPKAELSPRRSRRASTRRCAASVRTRPAAWNARSASRRRSSCRSSETPPASFPRRRESSGVRCEDAGSPPSRGRRTF